MSNMEKAIKAAIKESSKDPRCWKDPSKTVTTIDLSNRFCNSVTTVVHR